MAWHNPFAFRPAQVSFWTTLVYVALLGPLVYVHETVPCAPREQDRPPSVSLAEAWADLANVTRAFHPANSRASEALREWLLRRTGEILDRNGVAWAAESLGPSATLTGPTSSAEADVVVFDDLLSNVTFATIGYEGNETGTFFTGTNIYVYIRGTSDEEGPWWKTSAVEPARTRSMKRRGVLVNAHFDSVASGYGATDNGMGVVSALQLVKHFTTEGNRPQRGVVVLLNNAEEDGLYGARAFANSPLAPFISSFVNLEGAGAGGRAILFRSSDLEVTSAYRGAPHPFGSVLASDGFSMGWVRSLTDYSIFVENLGYRGLDVAFYTPRARYHTSQDDRRHTSTDSIWHMLGDALPAVENLASGQAGDDVDNGGRTAAVWFDLFGDSFVLFALRGMFAWSLTILITAPLIVALLFFIVHHFDRDYMFRPSVSAVAISGDAEKVPVGGLKGLSRFPLALVVAGSLVFGSAFLLNKVQPFAIYSSRYAVWAMMLSLFYFSFWCIMRGASFARPSALHRAYVHLWLFVISWAALVATTVLEDRKQIASGYVFVFWGSQVFLATVITVCDFFALPRKEAFAEDAQQEHAIQDHLSAVPHSDAIIAPSPGELGDESTVHHDGHDGEEPEDDEPPTETSPLVGGDSRSGRRTTFATGYRRSISSLLERSSRTDTSKEGPRPFGHEQEWSGRMPSWTWFLQFLLLGPFTIVLVAQLALLLTSATYQTGVDGSSMLTPYLMIAAATVLLFLPIAPFVHRVTHHVPLFCLAVFAGTLIYLLLAFPFSAGSPFKVYFRQSVALDSGEVSNTLMGHEAYVRRVLADLPSAAGKTVTCELETGRMATLMDCTYDGSAAPPVLARDGDGAPLEFADLVTVNATRDPAGGNRATLEITGVNTKVCELLFDRPVADVFVHGSLGWDSRLSVGADKGRQLASFLLWRRDWETPWTVDIEWDSDDDEEEEGGDGEESYVPSSFAGDDGAQQVVMGDSRRRDAGTVAGLTGQVVCRWSDMNTRGVIPAADEVSQYLPQWALMVIKSNTAVVQGSKRFAV